MELGKRINNVLCRQYITVISISCRTGSFLRLYSSETLSGEPACPAITFSGPLLRSRLMRRISLSKWPYRSQGDRLFMPPITNSILARKSLLCTWKSTSKFLVAYISPCTLHNKMSWLLGCSSARDSLPSCCQAKGCLGFFSGCVSWLTWRTG